MQASKMLMQTRQLLSRKSKASSLGLQIVCRKPSFLTYTMDGIAESHVRSLRQTADQLTSVLRSRKERTSRRLTMFRRSLSSRATHSFTRPNR